MALRLSLARSISGMNSVVEKEIRPLAFCITFEGQEAAPQPISNCKLKFAV